MANPKRKRKAVRKAKPHCECSYNQKITGAFDEAFDCSIEDAENSLEYHQALMHSDSFQGMLDAYGAEDIEGAILLSDAVRFGFEAGKRLAEIKKLEEMVGY